MSWPEILLGLFLAFVAEELFAYLDWVSTWLVRRSARIAPVHLRARLEEEWLADMAERPGRLLRLLFALDTIRGAVQIGADDRRAKRAASRSAQGDRTGEELSELLRASALIVGSRFEQSTARTVVKRLFDVASATALLVMALPVMVLTAIVIRVESRGPIMYRQERVGMGGRPFACLKFRSMRIDAERDGVARQAQFQDPRVTRVGSLIRKLRIDELPQLINVLQGEMSLVGPRPERPCFVDQLKQSIRFYDVRHFVKPGLTGWAQVRYSYGASVEDASRKLQFDLYYVKNHSLFMDLRILMRTVWVVLTHCHESGS